MSRYGNEEEMNEFDDYRAYGSMGTTFKTPLSQTIIFMILVCNRWLDPTHLVFI